MAQRILVVDDDPAIVKVLASYLDQAGFSVITASDGGRALALLHQERPDLVVLDVMLPGRDGWELTRTIRMTPPLAATPIILVTARVEATDKILGLEFGADDYITKPFNAHEVVARVRALLRRRHLDQEQVMAPTVLVAGAIRLDVNHYLVQVNNIPVDLTPTEFKMLHLLMEHPGHTLTREELLEQVLGYAYEGMGRTLDTHIRNLRKKIEADPDHPHYIQTVYGVGYRFIRQSP